jgi:hypothetical protein
MQRPKLPRAATAFVILNCAFGAMLIIAMFLLGFSTLFSSDVEERLVGSALAILAMIGTITAIANARTQYRRPHSLLIIANGFLFLLFLSLTILGDLDRNLWLALTLVWAVNSLGLFYMRHLHSSFS